MESLFEIGDAVGDLGQDDPDVSPTLGIVPEEVGLAEQGGVNLNEFSLDVGPDGVLLSVLGVDVAEDGVAVHELGALLALAPDLVVQSVELVRDLEVDPADLFLLLEDGVVVGQADQADPVGVQE